MTIGIELCLMPDAEVQKWYTEPPVSGEGIRYSLLDSDYLCTGKTKSEPDASRAIALAKALRVDIEWLFDTKRGFPPVEYHQPPPSNMPTWPPTVSWKEMEKLIESYREWRMKRFSRMIDEWTLAELESTSKERHEQMLINDMPDLSALESK